jgi:competence protein ComEC
MTRRPAVPIATAFAAGILLAEAGVRPSAWVYVSAMAVFGVCAALRRRLPVLTILLAVACLGWVRYAAYTAPDDSDVSHFVGRKLLGIQGTVVSDPDVREDRTLVVLRAESVQRWQGETPVTGLVMVTVYAPERDRLAYGERIFLRSGVHAPQPATNPGAFSWEDYLARQRIYSTASVKREGDVLFLPGQSGDPLISGSLFIKRWMERGINAVFPEVEGRLVKSVLLGNYAVLPGDLVSAFSRSGTLHLLAASGFNCMVLITVFGLPLARGLRLSRDVRSAVLICLLVLYMLIVGPKPSIVRATVMASLALLAYPLRRSPDPANTLFAAALIILAVRPTDLFDVGFQLSFAAVAAIMAILPVLLRLFSLLSWEPDSGRPRRGSSAKSALDRARLWVYRNLSLGLATTLAATLGTAPIIAGNFSYVSIVSPLANTAVAAAMEPIFAAGLAAPFVRHVPVVSQAVAITGTGLSRASLAVIGYLGGLPGAAIAVAPPGWPVVLGYYVVLGALVSYVSAKVVGK